jgi:hypothetical protein
MSTSIALCLYMFIGMALFGQGRRAHAAQEQALREARVAYSAALAMLKRQPTDPSLRQLALDAGLHYSKLTRESKGIIVFDEAALKHELDEATASGSRRH